MSGKREGPVFQHINKSAKNWDLPDLNSNNTNNCMFKTEDRKVNQ